MFRVGAKADQQRGKVQHGAIDIPCPVGTPIYAIADGYIETKEEIISLETDLSSSQIRNAAEALANDIPNDWVQFNLSIADVKSQKKSMLYVALSIVLGGMVGVMYVLISNAVRKRKESSAKA